MKKYNKPFIEEENIEIEDIMVPSGVTESKDLSNLSDNEQEDL